MMGAAAKKAHLCCRRKKTRKEEEKKKKHGDEGIFIAVNTLFVGRCFLAAVGVIWKGLHVVGCKKKEKYSDIFFLRLLKV